MKPVFLWARAGTRGTGALLDRLMDAAVRGEQCCWLVPEPYSHDTERLLAERGGAPVCLYAEVMTFGRLCDRILAAGGGLAAPVLDAGGRLLMLRRAVKAAEDRLTAFKPFAARAGFLPGLTRALDECKCYGISPDMLERAGAENGGTGRLRDLAAIFGAFDELCAGGPMDPRDRATLAREKVKNAALLDGANLYVSNFASFTPQERLLLAELADRAASLTLMLGGGLTDEGFEPLRTTARQMAAHFPQGVGHITVAEPEPGRASALSHLEKHWFARKMPRFIGSADGSIELWSAPGEAAEVRFAAERIVRLARDGGFRWRDIAVITSDYAAYGPLIESIFPQYRVPTFADSMDDLRTKPLSRCIRAAADCVLYAYRPADVMRLLRTGLLPVSASDADLTENYLRRWNPRGGRFSGPRDWTRGSWHGEPDEREREELARINAVRRHIASALKGLPKGKTARQCARLLYEALEALGVPEGAEARARALEAAGELKPAAECGQMWDFFCEGLEQCAAQLGDEPMGVGEFAELCLTVLSGYSAGSIPASLDRVHTGDQGRFPRIAKPVVIYIGAAADKVPARSSGEGLLSGEERAALNGLGCELPPDPPGRIERELYNFYTACALPSQKLILTYPLGTDGSSRPAGHIKQISDSFSVSINPVPPPSPPMYPKPVSRENLSGRNAAALYGKTLLLSASRIETFQRCPFSYFMRHGLRARERPEPGFTPLDVGLELHAVLEQCARYALKRGGFANVAREDMLSFAANEAGTRLDALMRRGGAGTPRLLAQGERLARTARMLAGRMWDEFVHSRFVPLDFELFAEGEEEPLGGDGEAPSAYKLRGVADRVDGFRRGDTLYLRVVDYKTGDKRFSLSEAFHGVSAQMPLYMALLLARAPETYRAPRAEAAGVFYLPSHDVEVRSDRPLLPDEAGKMAAAALRYRGLLLDDREILEAMDSRLREGDGVLPVTFKRDGSFDKRTLAASPERMALLQKHIRRLARKMAEEVAGGGLAASPLCPPNGTEPCENCRYRAACHFSDGEIRPMRGFADKDEFFEAIVWN